MKTRIIIFAKAPIPGFAKTRLAAALGLEASGRLARRLLQHTITEAMLVGVDAVELCMTPSRADPMWQDFSFPKQMILTEQGEGDLGQRMARALQATMERDEAALLIGSDCPALDAATLKQAWQVLHLTDSVIIPTSDGGYALLGLKHYHPTLFENIRWSSESVAQATIERIQALGWTLTQNAQLHDIDEAQDLQWLPAAWQEAFKPL